MNSRYNYMKASTQADEDGQYWPDVYSVNYSDYSLSDLPTYHEVSSADINKPWLMMYREYGLTDMEDVYLNMNGIPYVGMLEPGSVLVNFSEDDLTGFNVNKRVE